MKKRLVFISIFCFALDQLSKALLDHLLELGQSIDVIPSFFKITYVRNDGAAWSLFSGNQMFLILMTFLALFLLYHFLIKAKELKKIEAASYGLLLGGILGNLIDRMLRGYVIDFFDFNLFGYHFPVFNIADIAIVFGVLLLILDIWKGELHERDNRRRKPETN